MFSNRFIANFPQNTASEKILKIGQYLAKIWRKLCGLLFGPPCIFYIRFFYVIYRCFWLLPYGL